MAVEHHLVQGLVGDRGGRVQLALGFLNDDLQLPGELTRVDDRMAERVGLDVERGLQARRGKNGEVAGMVVTGTGVEIPTRALGLPGNGTDPPALGALEEHVLQDVGDPDPAVGLVEESRLDLGHHGHDGCGAVLLDQERQPVGQDVAADTRGPERRSGGHDGLVLHHDSQHAGFGATTNEGLRVGGGDDDPGLGLPPPSQARHEVGE